MKRGTKFKGNNTNGSWRGRRLGPKRGKRGIENYVIPELPRATPQIEFGKTIVYHADTEGTTLISRRLLLNLMIVPYTSTVGFGIIKSIRLTKIAVWYVDSSSTSPLGRAVENFVTWTSDYGKDFTVRGTSMGTRPSYIHTWPPPNSRATFWTNLRSDLSEDVALVSTAANSIIALTFDVCLENTNATYRAVDIVSGTLGCLSYTNFDFWTPQGYLPYVAIAASDTAKDKERNLQIVKKVESIVADLKEKEKDLADRRHFEIKENVST